MLIDLALAGVALLMLVFLSIIDSAYASVSEVSLRVMVGGREDTPRARFFRHLLDNRGRFELILIFGTQLSIAAISVLVFAALMTVGAPAAPTLAIIIVFVVILLF